MLLSVVGNNYPSPHPTPSSVIQTLPGLDKVSSLVISDHSELTVAVSVSGLTAVVTRKPSMEPRERETFHRASPAAAATEQPANKR